MNTHHEAMDDPAEFGAELNTREGYTRHCTGPCNQGRRACPCPNDCLQPEEDQPHVSGALAWPLYCLAAVLAVLACWHLAGRLVA